MSTRDFSNGANGADHDGPVGPLVSIIIPYYHYYTQYLAECLTSVIEQTYTNWELIVVDDASANDEGRKIVEGLGDSRISIIRHERNRGQAAARNTGIRASHGQFVMPVDCDDKLAPTHLEKLMNALAARPECNAAYADHSMFSAASGVFHYPVRDTRALLEEQWIPHPGTLVRRATWERVEGYCESEVFRVGNEDWDYWLRIAADGLNAVRVPEPSYHHRQHVGSITNSRFWSSDYITREFMYERHHQMIDSLGMRRRFLGGGYRVSGQAFWRNGEYWRAAELLLRAAWLCPSDFMKMIVAKLRRSSGAEALPGR